MWYAVNKNGRSFLFKDKPQRHYENCWFDAVRTSITNLRMVMIEVTNNPFMLIQLPPITWEDEPVEVFIVSEEEHKKIYG